MAVDFTAGAEAARPAPRGPVDFTATAEPNVSHETIAPDADLTWGDALTQGARNLPKSTGKLLGDVGHAVVHPVETAKAVGALGKGAVSKVEGALGVEQDPAEKAQNEAVINALGEHYAQTYGSGKGLRRAIATDPASVLMDVTTPLTLIPSGGTSLGLGAASTAGKVARVATEAAGAAGRFANPVEAALRVAGTVGKYGVAPVARLAVSASSGVPMSLQKLATAAGRASNPALRAAFADAAAGRLGADATAKAVEDATEQLKAAASADYAAKLAATGRSAATPDWAPIDAAITKARSDVTIGSARDPAAFKRANDLLDDIESLVKAKKADPAAQNLIDFDKMKKAIYDMLPQGAGGPASKAMNEVYAGVGKSLRSADPTYATLMQQWQDHLDNLNNITRGLSGPDAARGLARALKAAKTPDGQRLIDQVARIDPTIPYQLAGHAMNPWFRQGGIGELAKFGGFGTVMSNPALIPHVAAGAAAASPRLVGKANYAAGRGADLAGRVLNPATALALSGADRAPTAPPEPRTLTASNVDRRRLAAESGDRQFNPDGSVVTSPKGAVGAAQVMPGTGPEAAQLAGEPWDPTRLKSDATYNRKLGQAYFNKQMQDFRGDTVAALAAYNAGPNAVRKAMAQHGAQYLAFLPTETQSYVRKVLGANRGGRQGRAAGGKAALPMDDASRMARAKAQGFDVGTPLYHGTNAAGEINEHGFANAADRSNSFDYLAHKPRRGPFWFSTSKPVARSYMLARDAKPIGNEPDRGVIPVYVRHRDPLVVDARGANWQRIGIDRVLDALGDQPRDDNFRLALKGKQTIYNPDIAHYAKRFGYGSVITKNVRDDKEGRKDPSDVHAMLNAGDIRHVDAAFDPAEDGDPRIHRASGGRTGMNHAAEAAKLIRLAERAKNAHAENTKPLLAANDDAVASALNVAGRAI